MGMLTVSASPHIRAAQNTQGVMLDVIIALLPAAIAGIIIFGINALFIILTSIISAVLSEFIFDKIVKKRNTITDFFPARPRTKEFLIGYPALILFAYYMKKSDLQLIKWLLAVALSILAASITNSFCHVFTDFSVIVSRTINGFILGIFISAVVYIANLVLVKILNVLKKMMLNNNFPNFRRQ